jgi:Protein of unknown function (DUF3306)
MAGNHRHDSPDPDAGASGFLARWSARKRAAAPSEEAAPPEDTRETPVAGTGAHQPATGDAQKALTDQDMPSLESLNEMSDYSGFLSPGVSDGLHRLALRKLFSASKFQVRDGLDDYDTDYNLLQPLRRVLAGVAQDKLTQDELTQQLQHATEKLTVHAEDATDHPADEQVRSAADPPQLDSGPTLPSGRTEEIGK